MQWIDSASDVLAFTRRGSSDLVAYRVVQEALTHTLKCPHGSRTSVTVRHGEGGVHRGGQHGQNRFTGPAVG